METVQYPYPIATRISISKERRIRLPKFLSVPVPYVLVENWQSDKQWLGFCGLDSLARQTAECKNLQVIAEYRTCRPTIPKRLCGENTISWHDEIWLVAVDSWVELWLE